MDCVDDVLQYYRQFLCLSVPLVHAGHLSEEERDAAFWYGFHPDDREVLRPRLLGKNPFQPCEVPFHFEDVFSCARGAFAYGVSFSSWSPEYQFKPSSVRSEQPVAEHVSRDTYGLREMTRAVASNAEITPCELPPPSQSTADPQLLPSSSLSASELQHTPSPSSSLSVSEFHHPTTHSAMDDQPEPVPAPTFLTPSCTSLPSTPPVRLVHLAAEDVSEIASTPPLSSIASAPSSMPAISSECLPSATEDQSEPEPVSTPSVIPTSPALPSTPSLAPLFTDDFPELASAPRSSSPISPTDLECPLSPVHSASDDQPEPEPELASTSVPLSSLPLSTSTHALSATNSQSVTSTLASPPPDHLPASLPSPSTLEDSPSPEISTPDPLLVVLPPDQSSSLLGSLCQFCRHCEFESTPAPASTVDIVPLHSPEVYPSESSLGETIPLLSASLEVSVIAPIPSHSPPLQRPLGVTLNGSVSTSLEVAPSPTSTTIPSTPQQVLTLAPQWLLYLVPHWQLLRSQEPSSSSDVLSMRAPPFSHLSIPTSQWLLYLVPQLLGSQELLTAHEVSSMPFAPRLPHASPPLLPSSSCSAHFTFAFTLVTTTSLFSILLNVSKTIFTHARKFQSKKEDLGGSSLSGTPKTSKTCNTSAQWLGQYMPKASRFVFDPGGLVFVGSAHEDAYRHEQGREPKTRCLLITTSHATLPSLVLADDLVVFSAETPRFFF